MATRACAISRKPSVDRISSQWATISSAVTVWSSGAAQPGAWAMKQRVYQLYPDMKVSPVIVLDSWQRATTRGATLLGALFGRKLASSRSVGRATTALRGAGRAAREKDDIQRAEQQVKELKLKLQELEAGFEEDVSELQQAWDVERLELEEAHIRPRKSDIAVGRVALAWVPWRVGPEGIAEPAY